MLNCFTNPEANQTRSLMEMAYKKEELILWNNIHHVAGEEDPISQEIQKIKGVLKSRKSLSIQLAPLLGDLKQPWEVYSLPLNKGMFKKRFGKISDFQPLNELIARLDRVAETLKNQDKNKQIGESLHKIKSVYEKFLEDYHRGSSDERRNLLKGKAQLIGLDMSLFLSPEVIDKILIKNKILPFGGHHVASHHHIHWKLFPYAPGVEKMVDLLNKQISGQGSPPSFLVKILSNEEAVPLQASQTIPGINLQTFLEEQSSCILKIDPTNFSAMLVLTLLTDPLDGKPDNYIIQKQGDRYHIVGIDNDMAFSNIFIRTKPSLNHYLDLHCVLFFFPQMDHPVDTDFCKHFLSLSPEVMMVEWVKSIIDQNERYAELLKSGVFTSQEFQKLHLPIAFNAKNSDEEGLIEKVYFKILCLQKAMRANATITHRELFRIIHPLPAIFYEKFYRDYQEKTLPEMQNISDACYKLYKAASVEELLPLDKKVNATHTIRTILSSYNRGYREEIAMRNLSPSIALDRFLASIKWQELDPPGQIQLLQAIREIGHLSHLMIKGSTILEDSLLILLGKSLPKLERMTLLHCSQISENGLCGLIIANPTLHLVIGGCQKIKAREYFFLSHHSQNLSIQFATGEICRIDKTTPIPIHPAIHANEEEAFYLFLSLNTIRNSQDQEGYSALHLVVKMADRLREKAKNYLAALVFCGESLEFKDLSHETPLEKAERYSLERESYQELTCYLKRLENPLEVLREALPLRSKWADLINYRALWAQFVHQQAQTTPFIHLFPKPFDEITEMTLLNPLTEEQFIFIEKNCPNLSSLNCQFQLTLKQRQKFSRLLSDKSP